MAYRLIDMARQYGLHADWLAGRAYRCTDANAELVPLDRIREARSMYADGMTHSKLLVLIDAIKRDAPLPPITLDKNGRLCDGHHRIVLSRALGAACIPARIK